MENNCCLACSEADVPQTQEPSDTDAECTNKNDSCSLWAGQGECTKNPTYMKTNCCDACSKDDAECTNKNDSCFAWAGKGECTTNPSWMKENCCFACSGDCK